MTEPRERVRFDKWLWAARFYKTRTLAAQAIDAGQARVDDERVKPAHAVRVGLRVTVRRQGLVWDVEVIALSDRRGSAADAALLYRESAESVAARGRAIAERQAALAAQTRFTGRPTKRDRRKLEDFLNEP
ncbi:MAG TPA: RNA-binding S4 domain-containing protein [Casimicrobiaceae bacterium]